MHVKFDLVACEIWHIVAIYRTVVELPWILLWQQERLGNVALVIDCCKIQQAVESIFTPACKHKPS